MESKGNFIMQKYVDWSLLNHGIALPVAVYPILATWDQTLLTHGRNRGIKVLFDGELYDARLQNVNFNRDNFVGHRDIIRIMYGTSSPLAVKLRAIFKRSYDYYHAERLLQGNGRRKIPLPTDFKEYIQLFLSSSPDVICMDYCSDVESQKLANALISIPEEIYEVGDDKFFMSDKTASIVERETLMKYRKIDRNVIKMLKEFYDYKDEISGEKIGSKYGDSVVEAHHIDYFTKSQNNDSTNIIIISPNYHRIIHKNNPHFNRKKYQFEFDNGEVLKLKLFEHLRVRD